MNLFKKLFGGKKHPKKEYRVHSYCKITKEGEVMMIQQKFISNVQDWFVDDPYEAKMTSAFRRIKLKTGDEIKEVLKTYTILYSQKEAQRVTRLTM